jgi:class 3 adenylate cyclase
MAAAVSGPRTGIAAVLFTDVVGSTALRSSLGEEAAEALQATHDRLLADAVAGHRGVVVKGLGDGIMATFDSAADAVAAAVAIQQTIELVQRRSPGCSVLVRIGVSVGVALALARLEETDAGARASRLGRRHSSPGIGLSRHTAEHEHGRQARRERHRDPSTALSVLRHDLHPPR